MKPNFLRLLITGLAMLILGPVTGWILTILGLFRTATNIPHVPPGTIPDIGVHMQHTASSTLWSMLPMLLGLFIGALGFFLVILSLVLNYLIKEPSQAG